MVSNIKRANMALARAGLQHANGEIALAKALVRCHMCATEEEALQVIRNSTGQKR